jgi:DNA-binding LacI/PurR family transcriptional regulator
VSSTSRNTLLKLENIARSSGVSRSTASRVINHSPRGSEDTCQRVLTVISECNSRPNITARPLVTHRSRGIGILVPHDVSDLFAAPSFPTLLNGISVASNELGYNVPLWLAPASGDYHNLSIDSNYTKPDFACGARCG